MKTIMKTNFFLSSDGKKKYQTLSWSDGTHSCDCPGWTKRCVNGQRTCKHVREVQHSEQGATGVLFTTSAGAAQSADTKTITEPSVVRRFNFED